MTFVFERQQKSVQQAARVEGLESVTDGRNQFDHWAQMLDSGALWEEKQRRRAVAWSRHLHVEHQTTDEEGEMMSRDASNGAKYGRHPRS